MTSLYIPQDLINLIDSFIGAKLPKSALEKIDSRVEYENEYDNAPNVVCVCRLVISDIKNHCNEVQSQVYWCKICGNINWRSRFNYSSMPHCKDNNSPHHN